MEGGYSSQSEIIYQVPIVSFIIYIQEWILLSQKLQLNNIFPKNWFSSKNSGKIKHSLIGMDTDVGKDLEIPYKPQCSKNEKKIKGFFPRKT